MRNLSITAKLLVLIALPLAGLAFFGVWVSLGRWQLFRDNIALEQNSAVLRQIGASAHELQKERGRSAGFLGSKGTVFGAELRDQRLVTDAALAWLPALLTGFDASGFGAEFQDKLRAGQGAVQGLANRRAAISALRLTAADSLAYYTRTIGQLLGAVEFFETMPEGGPSRPAVSRRSAARR